jgi:hypothetical protein
MAVPVAPFGGRNRHIQGLPRISWTKSSISHLIRGRNRPRMRAKQPPIDCQAGRAGYGTELAHVFKLQEAPLPSNSKRGRAVLAAVVVLTSRAAAARPVPCEDRRACVTLNWRKSSGHVPAEPLTGPPPLAFRGPGAAADLLLACAKQAEPVTGRRAFRDIEALSRLCLPLLNALIAPCLARERDRAIRSLPAVCPKFAEWDDIERRAEAILSCK